MDIRARLSAILLDAARDVKTWDRSYGRGTKIDAIGDGTDPLTWQALAAETRPVWVRGQGGWHAHQMARVDAALFCDRMASIARFLRDGDERHLSIGWDPDCGVKSYTKRFSRVRAHLRARAELQATA